MLALAVSRIDVGNYVYALLEVYIVLILVYVVAQMIFTFARPAYSRTVDFVMRFLRDVCEPYLRFFRRFLPNFGVLDLSPTVGIIVLVVLLKTVPNWISG
jgi:YggT family protein